MTFQFLKFVVFCCYCSVAKWCLTFGNPMGCSMPGFPVLHHLLKFPQTHDCWVGDAIQLSHILLSLLCLPSVFPSIRVFSNVSTLHIRWPSIGASATASVPPMSIQDWFPLGWTGLSSLLSKGLARVFSNTTIKKHQFFNCQPSSWSNSYISTWLLEKP